MHESGRRGHRHGLCQRQLHAGRGQEIEFLRANAGATGLTLTGNELANTIYRRQRHRHAQWRRRQRHPGWQDGRRHHGWRRWQRHLLCRQCRRCGRTRAAGGGTDTVYASVNYTLGAGEEIEFLRANAGATGLTLTGNELANTIFGDSGVDTLNGGGGNDTLDGKAGADTMDGGAGNDTYYVDNAGDVVARELPAQGTDTVYASVNYTLGAGEEIEFLRANAGATGLTLTGNELANNIFGNSGADILQGGLGADTLTGKAGADIFDFNSISESGVTAATRDVITDFVEGTDKIDLSGIDADTGTANNQAFSFIGSGSLHPCCW